MKISPVASLGNTVGAIEGQASQAPSLRSMKMNTNAGPAQLLPEDVQKLPILDVNSEPNPTVEATQPISPQFAALARQRRALQVKERELRDKEKALEQRTQGSGQAIELTRLKSEPLSVLLEAGVTYDQLTEAILANQGNSEINSLKAELNALKEGVDKRFVEQQTQAEQQVLAEMRSEAKQLVNQGDTYELVRATGSVPDVMTLIERTYREEGRVMDVTEALEEVENFLFEKNRKLLELKKMQSLFPQQQPMQQPQSRPQGMRTLTNKDTASIPADRRQRALAAFYGTLKK